MQTRNNTIDVARGIGIFLIVFGHSWYVTQHDELYRVIFSFHLPLFFFLAGIFLRTSDSLSRFTKARANALLKPYFATLIIFGLSRVLRGTNDIGNFEYFGGVLYGNGNTIAWRPLWFLPHLFIAIMTVFVILKMVESKVPRKNWLILFAIVMLSAGVYMLGMFWNPKTTSLAAIPANGLPGLPWSIDLIPITASYILFGYIWSDQTKSVTFDISRLLISVLIFCALHYFFNETMDLNLRVYGNPVISTLQAAMGIYIVISLSAFLQRYSVFNRSLAYLGSGSLFILIFHSLFQGKVFNGLTTVSMHMNINTIIALAAGIFIPLILWEIAKRNKILTALLLPKK